MKLALVAYLHGAGGAERQITLLANVMAKRGHEVHFLVLAEYSKRYPISDKVIVHDLTDAEMKGLHPIIGRYLALKKAYKKIQPDITIHYNFQSAYLTLAMPRDVYCKAIYSERGDPYDKEYSGLLGKIRDWTVRRLDGLVFQSEGARDFFPEDVRRKSIVIHNSVNVPQEKYPIPVEREKRIVNVGRLHPQKNQKLLIEAFAQVSKAFPDYVLEIYGDGELHDELQRQIDEMGLSGRAFIHPSRKDLWDCIHKASLFVLSSDFEGMPNALMEAMALGLPCVSTDCRPGGARSLIENGVNGFIVPVGDVASLSWAMSQCLSKKDVSERIAINARKIVETHSEEVVFDKWEEFLRKL